MSIDRSARPIRLQRAERFSREVRRPCTTILPALAIAALLAGCSTSRSVSERPDARRVGGWTSAASSSRGASDTEARKTPVTETADREPPAESLPGAMRARNAAADRRDAVIAAVDSWMGTPYRFGGTTRSGVDCSAFVQSVFREGLNLRLPRTTEAQRTAGTVVDASEISFGDLVFFEISPGTGHVGVVVGPGRFAHSSSGSGVTISDLAEPYWSRRFDRAVRFDPLLADASDAPSYGVARPAAERARPLRNVAEGNPESTSDRRRGW